MIIINCLSIKYYISMILIVSTITLVNKGRSTSMSTRHINIRYFWLKERIESGEIEVLYKATKEMGPANIATKSTVGNMFQIERQELCNW